MSYSYQDSKQNVWRAPVSGEHGFKSGFSLPTQYPTYGSSSESVARNAAQSFSYQHSSVLFTSAGYPPQASYSDRPSPRFAEEPPDSTSVTMAPYIDTGPTVSQESSNQVSSAKEGHELIHSSNGTSGYLSNPRDSNLLPLSASFVPNGRDLKSLPVDARCHPTNGFITYPHVENYGRRIDGMGTQDVEPEAQKKAASWLITKFLASVHSSENQSNACNVPNADSAQYPQTIPGNYPAGSQPQPNAQSFLGRYSKDPVASGAVDLGKTTLRENPGYSWRPPPSNTTMRNSSPTNGEKVVSSSGMKQVKALPKKESRVDTGTLGAWTEYFRQLYLFNVMNLQHGEVKPQKVQGFDSSPSLPVAPPKAVPKLRYGVSRGRGRRLHNPWAATSGSAKLGIASAHVIPSKTAASRPTEEMKFGCRLCGVENMHWNAAEFQKHLSCEEHHRQYNKKIPRLDSTNDFQQMCCSVCNLSIAESDSFSTHSQRPEHKERKALIQKGCQLCKVTSFQCYNDFACHMNEKEHKENQQRSSLQVGSSAKNAHNSINVVDSTQDKSTDPDSTGSSKEATQTKEIDQMMTRSEKMIRSTFRPISVQKPKIEIKLSPRQPLLGLGRKIPESSLAGKKRMAEKLDRSEVVAVEEGSTVEELQKRLKIGNVGSIPIFPATADATEEKKRQEISSQDLQMAKNALAASNSLKDADTAPVIQTESGLLECKASSDETSECTEAALLSTPSEINVGSSSKISAEQNNGSTSNLHSDDIFVAVVGFYCKVCRTIYNREEVSEDQHRQSETHCTNLQVGVHLPLALSPGPSSSLLLSATPNQTKLDKQDEVSMPQQNVTNTSRVVDETHQEIRALKQPDNTAKDDQHLINHNNNDKPLENGISSQHLVHVNADLNNQDCTRPGSTCKSNDLSENSTEISSPKRRDEQSPKKLKNADGSSLPVEQQKKDDNQLKRPDLETMENCATKQGSGKRKRIHPMSCLTHRNPQENNEDVQKKMEDILEEIVSLEKAKDIQTEGQEVEKKIQTRNEEFEVRSSVSYQKSLVIVRKGKLPRKLVDTGSTAVDNSNTVEVKEEPFEKDSFLKMTKVENSYLNNQTKQIEINGQNLNTNHPGMCNPLHTHLPSNSDTQQLDEINSCSFNLANVEQEVMSTKESSTMQGDTLCKIFVPKSFNDSYSTGPSSETEIKNNGTTQMNESSSLPARNVIDSITENSVAVLTDKDPGVKLHSGAIITPSVELHSEAVITPSVELHSEAVVDPGVKLHSGAVTKTDRDLFEPINADVKNKGNTDNQPVGKMIFDGKKPATGKTIIFYKSANINKAVTSDKHVANVKILAKNTATSSDAGNKSVEGDISGASEKAVTNYKIIDNHEATANDKTLYNNKDIAILPVVGMAATKDGITQQNIACDKSVVDKEFADKTVVDNNITCKATTEELSGGNVGDITAVKVNTAQSASNSKNAANIANSKTQDAKSKINSPTTVCNQNNKSSTINKGIGSTPENCPTHDMSKSVETTGVSSSTEVPKPKSSSKNSDSDINTKSNVANLLLPASLEKGCVVS